MKDRQFPMSKLVKPSERKKSWSMDTKVFDQANTKSSIPNAWSHWPKKPDDKKGTDHD